MQIFLRFQGTLDMRDNIAQSLSVPYILSLLYRPFEHKIESSDYYKSCCPEIRREEEFVVDTRR